MLIAKLRRLTTRLRTRRDDVHLGLTLAFIAGAINAGGFLAVHQYTSHMTGLLSSAADGLVLGTHEVVGSAVGGLLSFVSGAMTCAVLVNLGRRHGWHSQFATPLLLEAALLVAFGLLGSQLAGIDGLYVPLTVMLLCFIMGLQNAVISKISRAEIRTTHVTGIITDIGIELGKSLYWNSAPVPAGPAGPPVRADRPKLALLAGLAGCFFAGGVSGALSFKHFGYLAAFPLALALVAMAIVPVTDDLKARFGLRD